ncbi:MAG TPA: hypothetical protein PLO65_13795, partial [Caulobacter sp.]|nr:hypothetical protein [Caulobacter sp.]
MPKVILTEPFIRSAATLAVGCCALAAGATALPLLTTPVIGMASVVGATALAKLFKDKPECEKAVTAAFKTFPKELVLSGEADEKATQEARDALKAALDRNGLFTADSLEGALQDTANVVEGLTALALRSVIRADPSFAAPGFRYDLALDVLGRAFKAARTSCQLFREQAGLTLAEITLAEVRDGFDAAAADRLAKQEELKAYIGEVLGQQLGPESPLAIIADLLAKQKLPSPKQEMEEITAASNVAPAAEAPRLAAKEAMSRNDIAGALAFMQLAEELEAREEARALADARDAQAKAETVTLSRAHTQATLASLFASQGDLKRAADLYRQAFQRASANDPESARQYARNLRIAVNKYCAQQRDFSVTRSQIDNLSTSIAPDVYSFAILIAQAPDYPAARAAFDEMIAAGEKPNVVTFSTLIARAPDYPAARAVFDEMIAAGEKPNVVTFST